MGKHKKHSADVEVKQEKEEMQTSTDVQTPVRSKPDSSKTYEELVALVCPIAKPMASRKLTKKLYKAVKKAQTAKRLKRGVREVVKGLRKNEKGLVVLAGDISPLDVISHIPVFCEDKGVPYCYVPSRRDLGAAGGTKRPTSVVLIQEAADYKDLYADCCSTVESLPLPI